MELNVQIPVSMVERHSVKNGDLLLARAIASQEHLGKAVVVYPNGRQWALGGYFEIMVRSPGFCSFKN